MSTLRDTWNPTIFEIRDWANSDEDDGPCRNWDFALRIGEHTQLYLDFVADRRCQKQMRFLDVLYETVQCWLGENPAAPQVQARLKDIELMARRTGSYYLMKFADDVATARKAKQDYDLDFWFEGGYKRRLETKA